METDRHFNRASLSIGGSVVRVNPRLSLAARVERPLRAAPLYGGSWPIPLKNSLESERLVAML
jgi:hypothetical protein